MKITDGIGGKIGIYQKASNADASRKKDNAGVFEAKVEDKVELTSKALDAQEIRKSIGKEEGVREDRVRDLKSSISDGTYNVSSEKVAKKILEESFKITI